MVKVLIKKLSSDVKLPSYKTSGASGMDLMAYIKSPITIKPKTSELISTGLSVAFSEEYEIQIRQRSGLAAKNNISVLNTTGTIDSDYRGELKVIIYNNNDLKFAEQQSKMINKNCHPYLQPEWSRRDKIMPIIVDYVMQNPKWKVSLQTHKYLNIP